MNEFEIIASFSCAQHGVITRRQLLNSNVSLGTIRGLLDRRYLNKIKGGIYHVTSVPKSWHQTALTSIYLAGSNSLLSHESVLKLHKIIDFSKDSYYRKRRPEYTRQLVHVVNPRLDFRNDEVFFHRSRTRLERDMNNYFNGIPHVSLERSIIDCSQQLTNHELSYCVDRAIHLGLTTIEDFKMALSHLGSAPGREKKRVNELIYEMSPEQLNINVDSYLEIRIENIVRKLSKFQLVRQYKVQVKQKHFRLDFAIPEIKLAIEVDGFKYHSHREAFDYDRLRSSLLSIDGWRMLHLTSKMKDSEIKELFNSMINNL